MNRIDIKKITERDAQALLDLICAKFNVVAKSFNDSKKHDVSYLEINGEYDDNLHTED